MTKEEVWLQKRVGIITASELSEITSASGKIIESNVDYIRAKRWERLHKFAIPVTSRAMEWGKENEPYAIEWYRTNCPTEDLIYAQDLPEIPFWTNPEVPGFGASPDAFTADETTVVEVKNVSGKTTIEFFFDPYTAESEKRARVIKEHLPQILGQFLANPKVARIRLLKYCAQNDDILMDIDSPVAPWRGLLFDFERGDWSQPLGEMRDRVALFNAFIASEMNPAGFKEGHWSLKNGVLCKE